MPQAEKLKLKEESKMVEKEVESPLMSDHKFLVRQIHDAYMKNFNMNKAKARLILTGKTSKPVKGKIKFENILCSISLPSASPTDSVFPSSLSSSTTWRRSSWRRER